MKRGEMLTVRLSADEMRAIRANAERDGMTVSQWAREALHRRRLLAGAALTSYSVGSQVVRSTNNEQSWTGVA